MDFAQPLRVFLRKLIYLRVRDYAHVPASPFGRGKDWRAVEASSEAERRNEGAFALEP